MEPNNVVPTRCASCNGHGLPQMFRPYCSVVCRTLGHAGLAWRTNPHRIIDIRSGVQVSVGPDFDLTVEGMTELQKHRDRLQERAQTNLPAPWVPEAMSLVFEPVTRAQTGMTNAGINLNA